MNEWVKDYQRIFNEIKVLDYHLNKDIKVTSKDNKQTILRELNVILNKTNKVLIKKRDQLSALEELSTMFEYIEHEIFVRRYVQNKNISVIAHELNISASCAKNINLEILNRLEFYSQ